MSSRNIMMGYLFNEDKTKEAIDENGWLHSGDLGTELDDGYFKVTGRLKELIITAGGMYSSVSNSTPGGLFLISKFFGHPRPS